MDNPLELSAPTDPVQRVHAYARDLAYLAIHGELSARIVWGIAGLSDNPHEPRLGYPDTTNRYYFREKWGAETAKFSPFLDLLASYGYILIGGETLPGTGSAQLWGHEELQADKSHHVVTYLLSPKAFQLLERPATPPTVFISYKRKESSAFALLIEARLRMAGVDAVFIDKSIPAGEKWHGELETRIKSAQTFISLIGPETLASPMVQKEIAWAVEASCRIISIWHNNCTMPDDCPGELKDRQYIVVADESAKGYETAINELLNSLGYRTY